MTFKEFRQSPNFTLHGNFYSLTGEIQDRMVCAVLEWEPSGQKWYRPAPLAGRSEAGDLDMADLDRTDMSGSVTLVKIQHIRPVFSQPHLPDLLSDAEKDKRGAQLAAALHLEYDHQGRWPTTWGNKTNIGLFETAKVIIQEGESSRRKTFFFNTGVRPESGVKASHGQVWLDGTLQIPFECDNVPHHAVFRYASNQTEAPSGFIIRRIYNSVLVSEFAFFQLGTA